MKSLKLLTICGATLMLVACTKDDVTTTASFEELKATQPTPVAFSTYLGDQAVTRAGTAGSINSVANLIAKGGFGVFAYYTNGTPYSSSAKPDFMYNQSVSSTDAGSTWTYSPVKYWPNETTSDSQSPAATSSHTDYVSFFAYAPYTDPSGSTGITAKSANNAPGDPTVTYKLASPFTIDGNVDLLWGVAGASGNSVNPNNAGTGDASQFVTAGLPLVNQTKQSIGGKVKFAFKHALASLKLTTQLSNDVVGAGGGNLPAATHVNIESVTITSTLPLTGTLNLNNTTPDVPLWTSLTDAGSVTFNLPNDKIVSTLQGPYTSGKFGVGRDDAENAFISTPQQVIADDNAFIFLPNNTPGGSTNATFTVTISYYVETTDAALELGYSRVQNTIQKSISFPTTGGNQYTINMILGLTTVKLNAQVDPWVTGSTNAVDLPMNVAP